MSIIIPLILLLTSWLAKSACPPPEKIYPFCRCEEKIDGSMMTCSNMHSFEDLIPPVQATVGQNMFSLYIVNSSLLYMPNGLFQQTNYKEIYIMGTELTSFSDSDVAFDGLEDTLHTISISNIHFVAQWDWSQLRNLRQIQTIGCTSCSMYSIDQVLLVPPLTRLVLSQSKISFIYDKAFEDLKKIIYIFLQGNDISELKRSMFPKPSKLQLLNLSANQLRYLPEDLFKDMPYLDVLSLNKNKFVTLNEKEFSVPVKKLVYLFIDDNPIQCDCRMRWIVQSRKPPIFTVHCSLPEDLKGVSVNSLNINQLWC